jgi:hypothetical protein
VWRTNRRKMRSRIVFALVALVGCPIMGYAATLSPEEAASHLNENATVCGLVASGTYAAQAPTAPTFLNLGKPYPDQSFTALILGQDRPKFGEPEISMPGKQVCLTGKIFLFEGKPGIVVHEPGQLRER